MCLFVPCLNVMQQFNFHHFIMTFSDYNHILRLPFGTSSCPINDALEFTSAPDYSVNQENNSELKPGSFHYQNIS